MSDPQHTRAPSLIALLVMSLAVVGYFVGLQSPMNPTRGDESTAVGDTRVGRAMPAEQAMTATAYSDMANVIGSHAYDTSLTSLKSSFDPMAEIHIEPGEKRLALAVRERNRAFNGAPPTIPHAIEQRSSASCMACHGQGFKSTSLRIPRMSHMYLENCTQCHVESSPAFMKATVFRESNFEGLPAPESGPRAFAKAPPQIPHTTWMRSDCMSCHGQAGLHGIRTTHPWRKNCQQCHAPSSKLDQTLLATQPQFLPGPKLKNEN